MVNTLVAAVLMVGVLAQGRTAAPPKPDLRKVVEEQAREIADLKRQVARLEEVVSRLQTVLSTATTQPAARPALAQAGKIADAMREGRLAVGMTLDQANKALKQEGKMTGEDAGAQTYEWKVWGKEQRRTAGGTGRLSTGVGGQSYSVDVVVGNITATVRQGKIVSFDVFDERDH